MAITTKVQCDGYSYIDVMDYMDRETIEKSIQQFEEMRRRGVISVGSYNDRQWVITDEVSSVTLNFEIDEFHFTRECEKKLGCTVSQYQQAMRVLITSSFGRSIKELQKMSRTYRYYADHLGLKDKPTDGSCAAFIIDLLSILPGDTEFRTDSINTLEDLASSFEFSSSKMQRRLSTYQSYFRFDSYLDNFWILASKEERVLYFPIFLWWKLTSILPLRPTEFVLIPRNCLKKNGDHDCLTIRRTRLKGTRESAQYSIEKDYEKEEFRIPPAMASAIAQYQKQTEGTYRSDIDTLFSKTDQFIRINNSPCDDHYTYANLSQCLLHYYRNIIQGKFGLEIVSNNQRELNNNEIEKISLGDTRHIAMISLIISGGSAVICKELAGHASIDISAHYYSNIKTFLDVLAFDRYHAPTFQCYSSNAVLNVSSMLTVKDGFCCSDSVRQGDYYDCISAVNNNGAMLDCRICKHFIPRGHSVDLSVSAEKDLKESFIMLRQAINQVRSGLGMQETIDCALSKLQANARQYTNAITKQYVEVNQ